MWDGDCAELCICIIYAPHTGSTQYHISYQQFKCKLKNFCSSRLTGRFCNLVDGRLLQMTAYYYLLLVEKEEFFPILGKFVLEIDNVEKLII